MSWITRWGLDIVHNIAEQLDDIADLVHLCATCRLLNEWYADQDALKIRLLCRRTARTSQCLCEQARYIACVEKQLKDEKAGSAFWRHKAAEFKTRSEDHKKAYDALAKSHNELKEASAKDAQLVHKMKKILYPKEEEHTQRPLSISDLFYDPVMYY